ncbi:N-acylneuraminate-9-phosphate synthase [Nitrosotalea devaniterrae]|uniref:N-acylneuraminate-9-phosphate synthase n=1 Tax=Nitrosotalea devaniterrae TaxID=1078905 RepID=A0A128A0Y1_9ARCH|nr:N-acylneuraminate-9-phosphate synthase [Candidatus Nitrosotalea devanaterra]
MMQVKIGDFTISRDSAPFIVAEAGINHNGEIEKAFEMIRIAKKAGVDAIKFQTFKAEEFVANSDLTFTYKSQGTEITESMMELFKRHEFTRDQWFEIKKKCDELDLLFFSTPQNYSDLKLLLDVGIPAIKIGSDDLINLPLLKDYSTSGLPIILSCGMSNLAEIYEALNVIGTFEEYPTILLLTTSQYPTPTKDVNLLKLTTLSEAFPNLPLGFSDHTSGPLASSLALALGARVFEKHFTINHTLPGPDHWFSEDPANLKIWSDSIKQSYEMLGDRIIRPTKIEEDMKNIARRSIVALCDIKENDLFDSINLGLRRPGNGLPPKILDQIVGKRATKNIKKGNILQFGDFK